MHVTWTQRTRSVTIRGMPTLVLQPGHTAPSRRQKSDSPHSKSKACLTLWSWSNLCALSQLSGCPGENGGDQGPQLWFPSPPCWVLATIQQEIIPRRVCQPFKSMCGLGLHAGVLGKHRRDKALESKLNRSPLPTQVSEIPGARRRSKNSASFWSRDVLGVCVRGRYYV